jgi:hypothetical protein
MKIRNNRRRILARIKANNHYRWFVMPIIKASEVQAARKQRITDLINKAFPELRGFNVRS